MTSATVSSKVDKLQKNLNLFGQNIARSDNSMVNHTIHIASIGLNSIHRSVACPFSLLLLFFAMR